MNLYGFDFNDPVNWFDSLGDTPLSGWGSAANRNPIYSDPTSGRGGAPFPLPLPRMTGGELREKVSNERRSLARKLRELCPKDGEMTVVKGTGEKKQCCYGDSCKEQANAIARSIARTVYRVARDEFKTYGNILGGLRGNIRARGTFQHGQSRLAKDEHCGLKCIGWSEIVSDAFFEVTNSYKEDGKMCFRGEQLGKGKNEASWFNHSWFGIWGPSREKIDLHPDVHIDPWPINTALKYIHKMFDIK